MKKRKIAAVALFAVLLITAGVICSWPRGEPVYKGKGAREYISTFGQPELTDEGEEAFKFFGTKAVPYMRASLRARDSWDRKALMWVRYKAPWLKIRTDHAWEEQASALRAYWYIARGDYWGDARATCVPEVRLLTNHPYLLIRSMASNVLAEINAKGMKGESR